MLTVICQLDEYLCYIHDLSPIAFQNTSTGIISNFHN